MSIIKFRKVPELLPNRTVRTVRTEQLWTNACNACEAGVCPDARYRVSMHEQNASSV